mmetsp:Transcript_1215/g.3736  ORF Transcript_1215/g.3736 Transcript_1215/m.3736 type:complete len:201 (+) Transcript_1215:280-882(+)
MGVPRSSATGRPAARARRVAPPLLRALPRRRPPLAALQADPRGPGGGRRGGAGLLRGRAQPPAHAPLGRRLPPAAARVRQTADAGRWRASRRGRGRGQGRGGGEWRARPAAATAARAGGARAVALHPQAFRRARRQPRRPSPLPHDLRHDVSGGQRRHLRLRRTHRVAAALARPASAGRGHHRRPACRGNTRRRLRRRIH